MRQRKKEWGCHMEWETEKEDTERTNTNLMSANTVLARCWPSRTEWVAAIILSQQVNIDGRKTRSSLLIIRETWVVESYLCYMQNNNVIQLLTYAWQGSFYQLSIKLKHCIHPWSTGIANVSAHCIHNHISIANAVCSLLSGRTCKCLGCLATTSHPWFVWVNKNCTLVYQTATSEKCTQVIA